MKMLEVKVVTEQFEAKIEFEMEVLLLDFVDILAKSFVMSEVLYVAILDGEGNERCKMKF